MTKSSVRATRDHTGPYVIVDFEYESGLLFVSVHNIGDSSAHHITVKFDRRILTAGGRKTLNSMQLFTKLGFLPPGKKLRTLVDRFGSYVQRKQPLKVATKVSYRDSKGAIFSSDSTHNLSIYRDLVEAM